jgi:hypothetical protein
MSEAAPPEEPAAAAEKKRPLLRRVPTSLVVTLLGIVLTAWLLPAFTRQWDDRQKAHEVRAALASKIAAATADAVVKTDLEAVATDNRARRHPQDPLGPEVVSSAAGDRLYVMWLRHRVAIEATLRANFNSAAAIDALHQYNDLMSIFFGMATGYPWDANYLAKEIPLNEQEKQILKRTEFGGSYRFNNRLEYVTSTLGEALLRKENEFIATILASHVQGYSTTTHDLLNDLIP